MHERQVEAPLGAALELVHEVLVRAPLFRPRGWALADGLREVGEGGDVDGRLGCVRFRDEEGVEAVVEVGEEEDFTFGESFEEGRLVYAVEGAGFDFAYAIMRMNCELGQ